MIREAALSGDCVAILPIYSIVEELAYRRARPGIRRFPRRSCELNAFYRRSPQVPAKVRMLLKYLKEQYDGEPPWERRLFLGRATHPSRRLPARMHSGENNIGRNTAMITLYHHGSSVCAAKVRLVLAEKSVPWDGVYVDILRGDQFDPAYMKLNPKAVVPTLVHDGNPIIELSVICEYLDETFPEPPLKPAAPVTPRSDAGLDQSGRRVSASGLRRDYVRVVSQAHHRPVVAGKLRRISRKHAADFGDSRLARA